MALRIEGLKAGPSRPLNAVMAILHLTLVGMLIYLRLGPMAKAIARFAESATPLPSWLILGITVGTFVIAAFIGLRGIGYLRAALRSSTESDPQ